MELNQPGSEKKPAGVGDDEECEDGEDDKNVEKEKADEKVMAQKDEKKAKTEQH